MSHEFEVYTYGIKLDIDIYVRGPVHPLGPGNPMTGARIHVRDIDALRQLQGQVNAAIDKWDARELKKEERRNVLAALRQVQKFEVKA